MKYTCSKCGHHGDTKEDKDPLQALNGLYKRFNDAEKLVREYVRLFVPASGIMTQPRERRLVEGLLKVWETGYFERNQRGWEVGKDTVADALRYICNNKSGLTGEHGYLLTILKAKAVEASKRAERDSESKKRARASVNTGSMTAISAFVEAAQEPDDPEAVKRIIAEGKRKLAGKRVANIGPEEARTVGSVDRPATNQAEVNARRKWMLEEAERQMKKGGQ